MVLAAFSFTVLAAEPQLRTVDVTGQGEIEAIPDAAWIDMAIESRNRKLDIAQSEVAQRVASFLQLTDRIGVDRKYIRTTGKTVRPEYRWDEKTSRQYLIGYYVSRQLQVDLRDLDRLGDLMHQAVEAGVNNVSSPQLRATNERELQRQALALAAADAKANAQVLASSLGARLGEVRHINAHQQSHYPQPVYRMAAMDASVKMEASQTYEAGQLRITAQVNASFMLE